MDYGTLDREIHIEATPEVVFDVVSSPEHLREWWPDEADYPVEPGGQGRIGFGGHRVGFTVVDAVPRNTSPSAGPTPRGRPPPPATRSSSSSNSSPPPPAPASG